MTEASLFAAALEKATPEERAAYLAAACAGDEKLRRRVEALLRAHAEPDEILDRPQPNATVDEQPVTEAPGTRIGPYKLLQQIGEGGMGVVYMAEQEQPVRRRVALKIVKPGMDSAQVIARFEAERQALALMEHPNIAHVFDAGTTDTGRPYFVMELVHGVPITMYCDENRLSPRQRLELFVPVCQAVQHAHQKGIIHRDLKPSNVMVTLHDGQPVPKVIDFGVAKATEQRLTERTLFTQYGTIVGTFEYMAPEQAEMSGLGVDTRGDIYSLGVLLYELLTGTTPLERKRLREAAFTEMLRLIKEEEPPRPSVRLSSSGEALATISQQRGTEPAKLTRIVRGELDWIVMKCLEKDRTRRYETASSLGRDLQRYLADEPVEACPPSLSYRLQKFTRKYRKPLAGAGAFALMLALSSVVSTWLAVRAMWAEAEARQQRDAAALAEEEARTEHDRARDANVRLVQSQGQLRRALYLSDMKVAKLLLDAGAPRQARERLVKHVPQPGEPDPRAFEWWYLDRASDVRIRTLEAQSGAAYCVAFSPDGSCLLSAGRRAGADWTAETYVWDAKSGERLLTLPENAQWVWCAAFSPSGELIATASTANTLRLWDARTGQLLREITGHTDQVRALAFHPDGRRLASGSADRTVRTWDLQTGNELWKQEHARWVWAVAISPDGKKLATASPEPAVRLWDFDTGKELPSLKGEAESVRSIVFSPDGNQLASAGSDGRARVWDLATGKDRPAGQHVGRLETIAFSPDGQHLASAGWGQQVRVRDQATGRLGKTMREHVGHVHSVAFSPDGRQIASGSDDGTVKIWDWQRDTGASHTLADQEKERHRGGITALAVSADGQWLATAGADGKAKVWNVSTGAEFRTWETGLNRFLMQVLAISPSGRRVAATCAEEAVKVWDVSDGKLLRELKEPELKGASSVAFHPRNDNQLAVAYSGVVKIWDLDTGKEYRSFQGDKFGLRDLAFSPDGERLVGASFGGWPPVWETRTGRLLHRLEGRHTASSWGAAFSPDGKWIATGSADHSICLWAAETGQYLRTLRGHSARVFDVTFSPNGRRVASASQDWSIKVWDAESGEETLTLTVPTDSAPTLLSCVAFSPDGHKLFAGTSEGAVRVWDATPSRGQ